MEINVFEMGTAITVAAIFVMGCIVIGTLIRNRRQRSTPEARAASMLAELDNQLRMVTTAIAQLKATADRQETSLQTTIATLKAIRQNGDDHASDVKTAVDNIAGAIDAARAEAQERNDATRKLIDNIQAIATESRENANNAFLTVNSVRKTTEEIQQQIRGIPELRGDIQRLQQVVTTPKPEKKAPAKTARATPKKKTATNGRRRKPKNDAQVTAAGNAPPTEPPESDASAAGDTKQDRVVVPAGDTPEPGATAHSATGDPNPTTEPDPGKPDVVAGDDTTSSADKEPAATPAPEGRVNGTPEASEPEPETGNEAASSANGKPSASPATTPAADGAPATNGSGDPGTDDGGGTPATRTEGTDAADAATAPGAEKEAIR